MPARTVAGRSSRRGVFRAPSRAYWSRRRPPLTKAGAPVVTGTALVSLGTLGVTATGTIEPAGPIAAFSTSFAVGNFTEFNSCQWTGRNDNCQTYDGTSDYSATVVAADGRPHVARFEVRNGDIPPFGGGERAEIAGPGPNGGADLIVTPGDERWFAFDMKLDAAFPNPAGWGGLLWQLHPNAAGTSPPLCLNIDSSGNLALANNDSSGYLWSDLGPAVKGVWRRYVIRAKFSDNEAVGFRQMWIDGVQVEPVTMCKTMIPGDSYNYMKLGHYRDEASTGTAIAYYDNLRITAASDAVTGTVAVTPGGLSVTATGLRSVTGSASIALGGLSVTATGARTTSGAATVPLGPAQVTAIGRRTTSGMANVVLGPAQVAALGVRTTVGSATITLSAALVTAVGLRTTSGTATIALGGLSVSATAGAQTVTGAASLSLGAVGVTAGGRRTTSGTAAVALPQIVLTANGTVLAEVVSGAAEVLLGALIVLAGATAQPPQITAGEPIVLLRLRGGAPVLQRLRAAEPRNPPQLVAGVPVAN